LFEQWSGDLTGDENPATLMIDGNKSVTALFIFENTPPVAMDDYATVLENSTNNTIDVLANDYDPDGDNLTIISVTDPIHGVSSHDDDYVYYTPTASYVGQDSFRYTISDGMGGTASATVHITVVPLNTPPYHQVIPSLEMEKQMSASPQASGGSEETLTLMIPCYMTSISGRPPPRHWYHQISPQACMTQGYFPIKPPITGGSSPGIPTTPPLKGISGISPPNLKNTGNL
jgi:hypothetical protein